MKEESDQYDVFQAIADPTRRKLLEMLAQGQLSISAMSQDFSMSRTAITKHLRVLESAGLVHSRKVGRERLYRLDAKPLQSLRQWLTFYERFWEDKLSDLKRAVEKEL